MKDSLYRGKQPEPPSSRNKRTPGRLSWLSVVLHSGESGRSLPAALITLAAGALLLTPFLSFVSTRSLGGQALNETFNEQYAAEAGVEYAMWALINDSATRSQVDNNRGTEVSIPFPSTDTVNGYVPKLAVTGLPIGEWFVRQNTSPYPVDQGGALESSGGSQLYALVGGFDNRLLRYNANNDTWTTADIVPFFKPRPRPDLIFVRNGSDLVYAGPNGLFALARGWQSDYLYNFNNDNWIDLPNSVKNGGPLVYTGGYIYLLEMGGDKFLRYNINNDQWKQMDKTPQSVGSGAALVYTGGSTIYALRGGNKTQFWRYDASDGPKGSWSSRSGTPAVVRAGGSLAYYSGDYIYALQGGSSHFWRYSRSGDTWEELVDTFEPIGVGGDLAFIDGNSGYALRGGDQTEYWEFLITAPRYDIESEVGSVDITARFELNGIDYPIIFWDIE